MDQFDIAIIGAGIHGVGIAQAAAARGYTTLVVEQRELAYGTSRRSSKLIHGGLRYLETMQLHLVYECLRERHILLKIAPELVHLKPFFLPMYQSSTRQPYQISAGLSLYALLGGLKKQTSFKRIRASDWEASLDGLRTDGLKAVYQYWDAQTDDAALTRSVMASARSMGAELRMPRHLKSAQKTASGYDLELQHEDKAETVHTRVLVNASGPWIANTLACITPKQPLPPFQLVQGTHIIVPGELTQGLYYVEAPQDRRAVFVMPWQKHTMVGTTETPVELVSEDPRPYPHEIDYLSEVLAHYFPRYGTKPQILDSFAGLRVLPGGSSASTRAFKQPRETRFLLDNLEAPRLITIMGGKLTAYRATAQKVLDRIGVCLPPAKGYADTATLVLHPTE